jgi:heme/copper-type cytochrome/quinol oxidase subunit 4
MKKPFIYGLGVASIILSRIVFLFLNDPEGPNLLIVVGLAVIIYALFLGIYWFYLYTQKKT